jgi:hypothetical protein
MDFQEKVLYHQIHPLKLATDIGVTPLALYFLWEHRVLPAVLVGFGQQAVRRSSDFRTVSWCNRLSTAIPQSRDGLPALPDLGSGTTSACIDEAVRHG